MSFSLQVKEELENVVPGARHCQLAELAALVTYGCVLKHDSAGTQIELKSENEIIGRKTNRKSCRCQKVLYITKKNLYDKCECGQNTAGVKNVG